MFGWRRKNDGFEWHEYVRTTIKLRREDRRRKIHEIQAAAAERASEAGQAGIGAGRSAIQWLGQRIVILLQGLRTLPWILADFVLRAALATIPIWRAAAVGIEQAVMWLIPILAKPGVAIALGFVTFVCAALAATTIAINGITLTAAVLVGVGFALLMLTVLAVVTGPIPAVNFRLHLKPPISWSQFISLLTARTRVAAGIGAVVLIGLAGWFLAPSVNWSSATNSLASLSPFKRETITGRAVAMTGDTLRIKGSYLRLSGIEAPELSQRCRNSRGRRWRCGRSARNALRRIVGRRTVECTIASRDDRKKLLEGTCTVGENDVARALVRAGRVFATGGSYASYDSAEGEARSKRRGIWRGKAQKPSEYRSATWDRAKRRAPEGCPIKGRILRKQDKVYVVPWAANYRRVRVRRNRGERWFCSENDAITAGWRPDPTG